MAWELWCGLYPFMVLEWLKYKNFEDFKREVFKPQVTSMKNKTPEEIEAEMTRVVVNYEKRR